MKSNNMDINTILQNYNNLLDKYNNLLDKHDDIAGKARKEEQERIEEAFKRVLVIFQCKTITDDNEERRERARGKIELIDMIKQLFYDGYVKYNGVKWNEMTVNKIDEGNI